MIEIQTVFFLQDANVQKNSFQYAGKIKFCGIIVHNIDH